MKANEFLEEVLHSELCPDNFSDIYKKFNVYQNFVIGALQEFHRICEEHGITYQVAYGSLIGAVRDGGQIPWDYDVDVFVPVEEREILVNALRKDLSDKYYFYCPESDKTCVRFFIRITPKGYDSDYLHMDVFYLIGLPDDVSLHEKFISKIKWLMYIRYGKYCNVLKQTKASSHRIKTFFRYSIWKIWAICHFYVDEYKEFWDLTEKYPVKSAYGVCSASSDLHVYPRGMMSQSILIETDLGPLRVPDAYDEILREYYGDYNELPSLERRINDVVSLCNRLDKFAKIN